MRRTRFQQGSLQVVDRAGGKKAREDRWYDLQADKEDRNNRWVLAAFGVIALGKPTVTHASARSGRSIGRRHKHWRGARASQPSDCVAFGCWMRKERAPSTPPFNR